MINAKAANDISMKWSNTLIKCISQISHFIRNMSPCIQIDLHSLSVSTVHCHIKHVHNNF